MSYEDENQMHQLEVVFQNVVKGRLGTVGILGNHDWGKNWSDWRVADEITSLLEKKGVKMLRNSQTEIEGLNFIGFDDYWARDFHPEKVMRNYNSEKANLVLCHNPDVCDKNVWNGYQGWILSGHTHGGQVKPPFLPPPILPVKNTQYDAGKKDLGDGRTLYINRALGCLHQVRFNVRPEITVFELQQE